MEKISEQWSCDACHEEAVTIAWRTEDAPDLEPVDVRAKCPVCGNVQELSFRPGTDPNTEETYTLAEWTRRGETERASRHLVEHLARPDAVTTPPEAPEPAPASSRLSEDELLAYEVKASQCRPPHVASTWTLVPPVNEWYAADVPRLVEEVRRLARGGG